jgi:hypothetical protein
MIDLKTAFTTALEFVKDTYSDPTLAEWRIEEFESENNNDDQYWLITVGFDRPLPELEDLSPELRHYINRKTLREYKVVRVNAETGEIDSMKFRSFA